MLRQFDSYDESRFWHRLDNLSRDKDYSGNKQHLDHLKASVRKVAEQAKWISSQVCRFMSQYTLHEERHFLNVLGIMDALLPDSVIDQLTPLECALPMLAAYAHDLGMALSQDEHDALQDESSEAGKHFASYRTQFDEELRQIQRWRRRVDELKRKRSKDAKQDRAAAQKRIDAIEGHILASYLRDTHTEDDQIRRLRHWLEAIKQETGDDNLFRYGNFDYQRTLALVGISHGRGAPWLRRQLIDGGPDDRFFQPVATGESANLAFPGLLLRLADVMDFDASRAPRILFKHFGIENDQSVLEWNKHLSIVGWRLDVDPDGKQQPDLLYSAECQHPVHEKAIREFKTWIDAELSAVRIELDAQRRQLPAAAQPRYDLHLPSQTRLDIRPARDPLTDQPKYVYHDLQFRLDQDEIQQLLMGESLYGDPGLCIRELLQNALDALELRELRLKMKQKGEAREPVDGELIRPGWVREPDGREEELRVTLDWGTDEETGQQWLRVTDNGVGMTEEVIKNYFTQIGKSFYRSPEFNQERAAMQAAGEVVSPISIFGIGILSCFMISNRMQVRTHAGRTSWMESAARDIAMSGPGSLFWLRQGSLRQQGTEITLFLGPQIGVEELKLKEVVISHAVWPRYPILVGRQHEPVVRIDDRYHLQVAAPVRSSLVARKAKEWDCGLEPDLRIEWCYWDWVDATSSGSRIRFWYPRLDTDSPDGTTNASESRRGVMANCRSDELMAFVESQITHTSRTKVLANGMYVPNLDACEDVIQLRHGIGTHVWIDLRGNAVPRLTIDRKTAFVPAGNRTWKQNVEGVFARLRNTIGTVSDRDSRLFEILVGGFCWLMRDELIGSQHIAHKPFDFSQACRSSCSIEPSSLDVEFVYQRLLQALQTEGEGKLARDGKLTKSLMWQLPGLEHEDDEGSRSRVMHDSRLLVRQRQSDLERERERVRDIIFEIIIRTTGNKQLFRDISHSYEKESAVSRFFAPSNRLFAPQLYASILQTGFHDDLSLSWVPFDLFRQTGCIGDAVLVGPGIAEFDLDNRKVHFADPQGESPTELVRRGYDLTFPMTAVPLGHLRRECGEWRSDRWYRPLGVAPFLLPALHNVWPAHAEFLQETFQVPHIYCLLPRFELWSKRFRDWTDADWHDPENLSALWDLSGHLTGTPGQVLWTRGTHDIKEMPNIGLPAPEFLDRECTEQQ